MATSTVENYLKCILMLDEDPESTINVGAIAEQLEVTPGTVSVMMRHLADAGHVDYVPRKSIALLPRGRETALQVVRRHRLIELFLVEVMKLDWSEVHEEAEVLEHAISDRLLDRIDDMLGNPTHDPHGDPIPDRRGQLAKVTARSLSSAGEGRWRVVRVSDQDSSLLDWLTRRGLTIGVEFSLSTEEKAAGLLRITPEGGEEMHLGATAAEGVFVEAAG